MQNAISNNSFFFISLAREKSMVNIFHYLAKTEISETLAYTRISAPIEKPLIHIS